MRNTVQRKIILSAVQKLHLHPTADDIWQEIQKEHPNVSKATVYRNLHQLAADNEIRLISLPDSPERFDSRILHHYHFRCRACGTIKDVDMDYLEKINEGASIKSGHSIDDHDIIFKGTCQKCTGATAKPFHT